MPPTMQSRLVFSSTMNYTPTKVGGFWEHAGVFRVLDWYPKYLTYNTAFFYHG